MTNKNQSTALVPTPKLHAPAIKKSSHVSTVKLVDDKTILEDKEEVRTKLPDILGRVLACIWIDSEFYYSFANDPKSTLEKNGVFFGSTINKTLTSYLLAILFAENVLQIVPRGTHEWKKFLKPNFVKKKFLENGFNDFQKRIYYMFLQILHS